ncbi:MAG: CPBP family intramembrane glutamic endopeptidase [Ginsengibacter sp.]
MNVMIDANSRNIKYPSQLGIFLGLTGAGLIISVLLSLVIWLMMEGTSFPHTAEEILQPKYYNVNMVLQAVSTFFIFWIPAYFFALICYRRPATYLGYKFNFNYQQILLLLGIMVLTFPVSAGLADLNKILPIPEHWALKFKAAEAAREAQEAALIQINSFPRYILSLFIIAFLPALFEETFFRGGMQNLLSKWFRSPWLAIVLTSIIFSIIHLSYYGFIVRFGLGVILGLIFYYSGSLWLSILFHFLFNGLQVTVLYFTNSGLKDRKQVEPDFPLLAVISAVVLLLYLFTLFKRISVKQTARNLTNKPPGDDPNQWLNAAT